MTHQPHIPNGSSSSQYRLRVGALLDRVLQIVTTGKKLKFLGLGADGRLGGDGAAIGEREVLVRTGDGGANHPGGGGIEVAASTRNALMIAAQTHGQLKQAKGGGGGLDSAAGAIATSMSHPAMMPPLAKSNAVGTNNAIPTSPALNVLLTQSLSDCADPALLLGFLTCALNLTNQILHPCILVTLFGGNGRAGPDNDNNNDNNNKNNGTISWNARRELTPLL